jgi:F-type H+-transporting ATPase subunit b
VEFDRSLFVIAALFWVGYWVLRTYFFKPLLVVMSRREERLATARGTWEQATAEAQQQLAAERDRLQEARRQATARREAARREAHERRQLLLEQVKGEVQAELASAREQLGLQLDEERRALEEQVETLAGRIAERLLGRAV